MYTTITYSSTLYDDDDDDEEEENEKGTNLYSSSWILHKQRCYTWERTSVYLKLR